MKNAEHATVYLVLKDTLLPHDNAHSNTHVFARLCQSASPHDLILTYLHCPPPADRLHSAEPRTHHLSHLSIHKAVEIVCE